MRTALTVLAVAFVSAFLPVVNIESYVVLISAAFVQRGDTGQIVLIAAVAAVGQMAGKWLWYEIGRGTHRWPWLQRRLDRPRLQARLTRWTEWTASHRSVSVLVLLASATAGLPPFLVMSIVAGRLRIHRAIFLSTGLVGRFVRFLIAGGLVDWFGLTLPLA